MIFLILETKFSVSEPRNFGGTSMIKISEFSRKLVQFPVVLFSESASKKGSIPAFSNTAILSSEVVDPETK